jgi:hypothetical protein
MGRYLTQVVTEVVAAESNTALQCGYYVLSKKSELGTSCRVTPTSRFPFSQQGMFFPGPHKAAVAPKITRVYKKEKRESSGGRAVGRPANSGS